jgi:hypothetical protein
MCKEPCIGTNKQFRSPLQGNSHRFQTQNSFERRFVILSITCIVALLVCASSALAQTATTGALTGVVTDPSGAVISGANVALSSTATGQVRTTTTDTSGAYKFSLLPPGSYSVTFGASGFKTAQVGSVGINVTETAVLNQKLDIGAQTAQVTVESTIETVQTENATIGGLVGSKEMTDLPLSSRNYTQIIDLAPGVVTNVATATAIGNGTQDINVNGSGSDQNNYMMDGATITNYGSGGGAQSGSYAGIGIPNPDSIEEFKVQTSQYDASYGQNPGASVNVVTKSGTNQFHGALWEFNRNNFFNANDFFLKHSQRVSHLANEPPELKQNQFGGTLGGPIKRDKIFFFGSYQGTRQLNGIGTQGFVTGLTAVGLYPFNEPGFSGTDARADHPGFTVPLNLLPANPSTCDASTYRKYLGCAFAGYKDPVPVFTNTAVLPDGSNINQVALNVLQAQENISRTKNVYNQGFYVPSLIYNSNGVPECLANGTSCSAPTTISQAIEANEDQFLANSDYVLSSKHRLTEKYFYSHDPQIQSFSCFGPCYPGAPEDAEYNAHSGILRLTSVLTNNFVNEAWFSFQRLETNVRDAVTVQACDVGITPNVNNGTPCPVAASAHPEYKLIPVISTAGLALAPVNGLTPAQMFNGVFGLGGNFASATRNLQNQFQGGEQISWNHGKHSIRAGFGVTRIQWNWNLPTRGRGDFLMGNIADFLTSGSGAPNTTPTFVPGGILAQFSYRLPPLPASANPHHMRINEFSAFTEDDIKVNRRLTVNLGLRWEYDGWPSDALGVLTNFWESQAALVDTGSFFLSHPIGTLAGYVAQSNYNKTLYGDLTAPNGASGIYINNNRTVLHGAPIANFAPRIGLAWQPIGDRFVVRAGYGIFYDRVYGNLLGVNILSGLPPYSNGVPVSPLETLDNPFCGGSGAAALCPQVLGFVPRTLTVAADPNNPGGVYGATRVTGPGGNGTGLVPMADSESMGTPLIQQYNLDLQYDLGHNWVADVGYVGTHGTHLFDWNASRNLAYLVDCGPASATCNPPTDLVNQLMERPASSFVFNDPANTSPAKKVLYNTSSNYLARTAYLGLTPANSQVVRTDGDHLYNGLQAQIRHRFSHGLSVQASYTWSKLITNINASVAGSGIAAPGNVLSGSAASNDPGNKRQQYGLAAFNRPQRFVLSYAYDVPYKGEGVSQKLLGGWTVSGVTTIQNGLPFTVIDGSTTSLMYYGSGYSAGASGRAELADPVDCNSFGNCRSGIPINTPGGIEARLGGAFGGPGFIDTKAFVPTPLFGGIPNPHWVPGDPVTGCNGTAAGAGGTPIAQFVECGRGFGNSGIGIMNCCMQHNWDFSIIKNTQVGGLREDASLQFRAEFFNVFNHPQFNPPVNDRNSPNFGRITTASVPGRVVQFALKYIF